MKLTPYQRDLHSRMRTWALAWRKWTQPDLRAQALRLARDFRKMLTNDLRRPA